MTSKLQILSRRDFLSRSTRLAAAAALATLTDVPLLIKQALADGSIGIPGGGGKVKKVFFLFLRGGNDSLNALVPINDPAYATSRPTIAIPKNPDSAWNYERQGSALWIPSGANTPTFPGFGIPTGNGFAALHPSLKFLVPAYNAGHLAMIHRVAYPRQSRSHFDSQNYWETGVPNSNTTKEGVLYRAMVESGLTHTNALTGVSIQSSLPLILRGSGAAMTNLSSPERYDLFGIPNTPAANAKAERTLVAADQIPVAPKGNRDLLNLQYVNMTQTLAIFQELINGDFKKTFLDNENTDGDKPYSLFPQTNATNGGGTGTKYVVPTGAYSFMKRIQSAAVILNKTDAIVAGTQLDGFDTHSGQGGPTGSQANLLRQVGWTIYALQKYFTAYGDKCRWEDVVVVTLSEFGRTTVENDDNGTDHAEASTMWVAGGGIKGFKPSATGGVERSGVINCGPNDPIPWVPGTSGTMFGVEKRYLKRAADYRSIMGRIIRNHLGATQEQLNRIIPGYTSPADALKDGGTQTRDKTPIIGEPDIV